MATPGRGSLFSAGSHPPAARAPTLPTSQAPLLTPHPSPSLCQVPLTPLCRERERTPDYNSTPPQHMEGPPFCLGMKQGPQGHRLPQANHLPAGASNAAGRHGTQPDAGRNVNTQRQKLEAWKDQDTDERQRLPEGSAPDTAQGPGRHTHTHTRPALPKERHHSHKH